jgi:lactoylglutathione lyase
MPLRRLHHAGIYVSSLARSIAFYADVFGLCVAERLSLGDEEIAFLTVGTSSLELIERGRTGPRATGLVDHVALEVDDLDGLLGRLRERGVRLLDQAPLVVPGLGARILFCLGPDDERIELLEYDRTRDSWPAGSSDPGQMLDG